jgi:pyruvate dehydrogenase E2 component (dihydrolipoyllysine-residue acetyltransferase)
MPVDVVMPRLSDSMEEGTILKWMKGVGDEVALGDELVEIETDKANMVFEADAAGTLIEIVAGEGDTLPIGEVIARVGEASEARSAADGGADGGDGGGDGASPPSGSPRVPAADSPPDRTAPAPESEAPATAAPDSEAPATDEATDEGEPATAAAEPAPAPAAADGGDGRVKASPLARRIARERGVDLATLSGSGPGGRIIKADVEGAGAAPAPAPAAQAAAPAGAAERPETAKGSVEVIELTKLQQTVSRRMAESKATAPHFYLQAEVDMTRAVAARAALKAAAGPEEVVPSFNDMVIKAAAIALGEFPRANGAYRDGRFELYSRVNVGIAVAAAEALVVPTIFDADKKGLRQIATEARALAERVRERTITPPELSGATFTVSNLGMYGVSNFHPVINSPQAAILAVGAIAAAPVVRDGELAIARRMGVTLACDHRILYGADGAEFLARVRALLTEPLGLAL